MSDLLSAIHEEVDRMTEKELLGLKEFLATYPTRSDSVLRNAPWDDEAETEEERLAVAEAREWLEQNGGQGIPDEEIWREFGLEPGQVSGESAMNSERDVRSAEDQPTG